MVTKGQAIGGGVAVLGGGSAAAGAGVVISKSSSTTNSEKNNGTSFVRLKDKQDYSGVQTPTTFGAKYAEHLLSVDEDDNKDEWNRRVEEAIALSNPPDIKGYLVSFSSSLQVFKSLSGPSQKEDLKAQIFKKLKEGCQHAYESNQTSKPDTDNMDWNYVWIYCSVDKKEHWI